MPYKDKAKDAAWRREYNKLPRVKERRAAYYEAHPEMITQNHYAWERRNPEKIKAQLMLRNAIRYGKIVRPKICPRCGNEGSIDAHHPDYSKPLEVEFLCRPCHLNEHRTPS